MEWCGEDKGRECTGGRGGCGKRGVRRRGRGEEGEDGMRGLGGNKIIERERLLMVTALNEINDQIKFCFCLECVV